MTISLIPSLLCEYNQLWYSYLLITLIHHFTQNATGSCTVSVMQSIQQEWHLLGLFKVAIAENKGRFLWKCWCSMSSSIFTILFLKFIALNLLYGLLCMHLNRGIEVESMGLGFCYCLFSDKPRWYTESSKWYAAK